MPRGVPKSGQRARRRTKAEMLAAKIVKANEHPSKQAKVRTIKPKKVKEPIMEKQPKPPKATTPNRQLFANEDFVSSGSHADKKEDHILCTTFSLLGARRMIKLLRNYECHDFTEPFEENGMFKFYYKNK